MTRDEALDYFRRFTERNQVHFVPEGDDVASNFLVMRFDRRDGDIEPQLLDAFEAITGYKPKKADYVRESQGNGTVSLTFEPYAGRKTIVPNGRCHVALAQFAKGLHDAGIEVTQARRFYNEGTSDGVVLGQVFIEELKQQPFRIQVKQVGSCDYALSISHRHLKDPAKREKIQHYYQDGLAAVFNLTLRRNGYVPEGHITLDLDKSKGALVVRFGSELPCTKKEEHPIFLMARLLADEGVNFPGSAPFKSKQKN